MQNTNSNCRQQKRYKTAITGTKFCRQQTTTFGKQLQLWSVEATYFVVHTGNKLQSLAKNYKNKLATAKVKV